jgi:hypothetical protein
MNFENFYLLNYISPSKFKNKGTEPKTSDLEKWKDLSTWTLLFANLLVILIAYIQNWNFELVLWTYWGQSLIIGFLHAFKMLIATLYPRKEEPDDFNPNKYSTSAKIFIAVFFLFIYIFMHIVTFKFLLYVFPAPNINLLILPSIIFLINHLFSFIYNYKNDLYRESLSFLLIAPIKRIVSLQLSIYVGLPFSLFGNSLALISFMLTKTALDLRWHEVRHSYPIINSK